mmetsp:Transcript_14658/g.12480  ORF Transcript_14658/g.12480 Transcript_14658/m.12480 type:complete len:108 (+) Transcript_14658:458-781(+)
MWLAPLLVDGRIETSFNTDKNQLFVSFDQPIVISCIKFWNYSKDRLRGIKELEISLDDNIIYRGYIRKAPTFEGFQSGQELHTTVLFTKNDNLIKKLRPNIYSKDGE